MTKLYEAHITYAGNLDFSEAFGLEESRPGWTQSWIEDDPTLGKGHRTYLSATSNDKDLLLAQAMNLCGLIEGDADIKPVRVKIEKTMIDLEFDLD